MAASKTTAAPTELLELLEYPIGKVHPDPRNPRKNVAATVDDEFVASITNDGILQPIVVRPFPGKDDEWMICFGERRYTAAKKAGLKKVPILVRRDLDEATVFGLQVVENLQRTALTPLEEAQAYVELVNEFKVPQRDLIKRIGRSQSYLSKHMSLATERFPDEGRQLLDSDGITVSDAILLASLHDLPNRVETVLQAYRNGDKGGYYSGPDTLHRNISEAKRERVVAAAVKKVEADGHTVVPHRPGWPGSVGLGAGAFGVELDPAKHKTEECHRVYIDQVGDIYPFCSDRDRHAPDGDSKLKAPNLVPQPDPENPIDDFAREVESGAGHPGASPANPSTPSPFSDRDVEWAKRREEQDRAAAALAEINEARAVFIRTLLSTGWDRDAAQRLMERSLLTIAADEGGDYWPDADIALDLLGLEPTGDDAVYGVRDFGPSCTAAGCRLLDHAGDEHHPAAALATVLSLGEALLGGSGRGYRFRRSWDDEGFADGTIRAHYAFLQISGYTPHERELTLLAGGENYRRANGPHEFLSTGDNVEHAACDICGQGVDQVLEDVAEVAYLHTNAEQLLAAQAPDAEVEPTTDGSASTSGLEPGSVCPMSNTTRNVPGNATGITCPGCGGPMDTDKKGKIAEHLVPAPSEAPADAGTHDVDPAYTAFVTARSALVAAKEAKQRKGLSAIVDTFEDARAQLLVAVARILDADPLAELGDQVDALGEYLASHGLGYLANDVDLSPRPATNTKGTVRVLHVDEIVASIASLEPAGVTADREFAGTISGYFDFDDDEAVNRVALWVDDHNLTGDELRTLLRVEEGNAEANDRPFLRAALAKLIEAATPAEV